MDQLDQFKSVQKEMWASFTPVETFTSLAAPHLVRFAGVTPGARWLDVACGTGVVAITAAQRGARVSGVDLTPELVARAKENAALANVELDVKQGDAESLPYEDAAFDVTVSQFGHMFAPRPDVTVRELLRVTKPGGVIAFSTWPPELFTGKFFALLGRYSPPLPPGASPPPQWGDPTVVRQRLGDGVKDVRFDRAMMFMPGMSPHHVRTFMESSVGPLSRLVAALGATDPAKLASLRSEVTALLSEYFEDNALRQGFLMTRCVRVG